MGPINCAPNPTTHDYGCNTEIYGLIRIATDDAGSYPWLILRPIREWALSASDMLIRINTYLYRRKPLFVQSVHSFARVVLY